MTETSFEQGVALVNGIRMHYVRQGTGPLAMLLHGWPQTWYCWRKIIPPLAARFTVIAPDLRGYGLTDKPQGGYDKRTMAADVRALARTLGYERLVLVGHDRGGRVAHRYALDYPDEVEKLAVLDIIPTRAMWERLDLRLARGFWHWLFHLQPDLPEALVADRVESYIGYFFERWTYNRPPVEEAVPEYVRSFSRPGALRAGFADYRASFPEDAEADDASAAAGQKLEMPCSRSGARLASSGNSPRSRSGASTRPTCGERRLPNAATSWRRSGLRNWSSGCWTSCGSGAR